MQIPARRDAEAIAEAVLRPTMKFIANSTCRRCTECVNGWSVSAPALEDYVHRNR